MVNGRRKMTEAQVKEVATKLLNTLGPEKALDACYNGFNWNGKVGPLNWLAVLKELESRGISYDLSNKEG